MIKGVLFDLDGVITDTAHYHFKAWKICADSLGITIDEDFNESLKGIDRINSLKRILEFGNVHVDESKFQELLVSKNENYLNLISQMTKNDILDGIIDFLDKLDSLNIKKGICSVSLNAQSILNFLELSHRFDVVVDPRTLKYGKPAPDIFLEGARLLGLETSECLGIEDSAAGIISIQDANMKSVGIGVLGDVSLKTTKELIDLIL